ncbi:MAG: hypothetical protein WAX07_01750 [Candidatus Altiarchaeia archaeon]
MDFSSIVTITVGICLYLLIPGIALSLAAFPRKQDMNFAERLCISTFLGMATPFVQYSNEKNFMISVNPGTTLITLGALTLAGLVIWQLRLRMPETQKSV